MKASLYAFCDTSSLDEVFFILVLKFAKYFEVVHVFYEDIGISFSDFVL